MNMDLSALLIFSFFGLVLSVSRRMCYSRAVESLQTVEERSADQHASYHGLYHEDTTQGKGIMLRSCFSFVCRLVYMLRHHYNHPHV